MHSTLALLFGGSAIFFFVVYFRQTSLNWTFSQDGGIVSSFGVTAAILIILYGLYLLIRRLRPNRFLWNIIFGLCAILAVLLLLLIPEIREMIGGWIAGISLDGERPIALAVLCLIACGFCLTRPASSTSAP